MTDKEKLINILINLDTYGCEECQNCASFKKENDYRMDKYKRKIA